MLDQAAQAREMFAQGYSIHQVAQRLGVEFKTARGWKNDMNEAQKARERALERVEEPEKQEETFETFELGVPTRMMEPLFSTFTDAEKGLAIATVLQRRLDDAISAFDASGEGANDGNSEEATVQ